MTLLTKGQTNRLLGYPPDARLLIINADDFGMCHAFSIRSAKLCLGVNNPGVYEDSMHFFGQRDGVWYYVVVKFR